MQLYAKHSKCRFGVYVIDYLGHLNSNQGVMVDPATLNSMVNWPGPHSFTSLRDFFWD